MPTDHRSALASIKRFDQLIAYLRDEMGWPIARDSFEDVDDLFYDFTADELGIDPKTAAQIESIKRLRPLSPRQPWGIFFVKFEPKRLPVVALRRILSQVALKKRASANSAERTAWAKDDLLFVSNYGVGDERQISFAHFSTPTNGHDLPTLKVLGWDNRDTALHLDTVATELTEHLAWPKNDSDARAWREQWRAAFTLRHREVITTSRELSVRLAALARTIRDRITTALAIETKRGPLNTLMKAFQAALVHDLDADGFADMYAQTIAYGLLSARIADPHKKTVDDFASHMRTNPFLRDLMETFLQVGGRHTKPGAKGIDFDELGVAEVVELLDNANMDAVVRDFGDRNPREDPVIHFYELFLKEYDAEKRMQRGVFYTPRPVVSYIVRSVHAVLRSEFGLKDGLADTATWGEMAERHEGLRIPDAISPDQGFVQILDPATGTGTFLVEAIDLIHKTLVAKWKAQEHGETKISALWNEYVPEHLLPRLHGYELLMAPYAIAHLKISLKLYETGYRFGSHERARVYLTNALESAQDFSQGALDFAIPALADEAQAVNEIKRDARFTVIIGNPPYSGHSANKGAWIRELLRGSAGTQRAENYFEVDGGPLNERNPKWLNDDYVKFIRLASWQIERTGRGVLGFITNHSYLDNPTFRGMRESLAATFPRAHLLDLHGNAKKKDRAPDGGKDENVFDIQQGVAIGLFTCPPVEPRRFSRAYNHADVWGVREQADGTGKYDRLVASDAASTKWQALSPKPPLRLFVPRDDALHDEYEAGASISDIFPVNSVGIVTARDKLAIQWTAEDMGRIAEDFAARGTEAARTFYDLGKDAQDWQVQLAQEDVRRHDGDIRPVLYRPFDRRFTYYTGKSRGFICRPRPAVMRHMLAGKNLALITSRMTKGETFSHAQMTRTIAEVICMSPKTSNNGFVFPIYLYPGVGKADQRTLDPWVPGERGRRPNLDPTFVRLLEQATGLTFVSDQRSGCEESFGPECVLGYIYAILHSPEYRRRYADFLKSDFPRVPLPGNRAVFSALIFPGARLVSLHLMETEDRGEGAAFHRTGSNQVDKVRYAPPSSGWPGRVWINREQYFESVDPEIWAFTIGGYRPAEKWLKDRKGRTLSEDDIDHYRKIVAALTDTRRLMTEIDEVIGKHGGWPGAFQTGEAPNPATMSTGKRSASGII